MKAFITIIILTLVACDSTQQLTQPVKQPEKQPADQPTETPQEMAAFSILPYDKDDLQIKEIGTIEDVTNSDNSALKTVVKRGFRVQIMVLGNFQKAKQVELEIKNKLSTSGHQVYLNFYSPNYRIRVGDFADRDGAKRALPLLKKLGYKDAYIVPDNVNITQE